MYQIGTSLNRKKHSSIWALQVKNVLGAPLNEGYFYNYKTKQIEEDQNVVFIPVVSYKVEF